MNQLDIRIITNNLAIRPITQEDTLRRNMVEPSWAVYMYGRYYAIKAFTLMSYIKDNTVIIHHKCKNRNVLIYSTIIQ